MEDNGEIKHLNDLLNQALKEKEQLEIKIQKINDYLEPRYVTNEEDTYLHLNEYECIELDKIIND